MKRAQSNVDSILPWRDRPAGDGLDEDRAAALVRDVLVPGAFPVGLDDRQLAAIAEDLQTERRGRPPFWIRPALVAALLTVSVASVLGYETGWFAPVRERLRFRSFPPCCARAHRAPEETRWAFTSRARRTGVRHDGCAGDQSGPGRRGRRERAAATAEASRPARPAREGRRAGAEPEAGPRRPPPPVQPAEPSEEVQTLQRAMGLLRGKHDAPAALAALDDYVARFPNGVLAPEARVARIDALLLLDRSDEALRALEALPLDAHRRSTELQLIRGELRARTDCGRADADFTAVLAGVRTAALEERALYGRAACRSSQGDAGGAADDLRRYVDRFPNGAHAEWARRWLQNKH